MIFLQKVVCFFVLFLITFESSFSTHPAKILKVVQN